jgi:hypothetical protein
MLVKKTLAAAGLLAMTGVVAACGGGSSSSPAAPAGAVVAPSGASTSDFCGTFQNMDARHGFEVLVDHLETLPDNAKSSDLTAMEKGLSATDQKDVLAFTTYLAQACVPSASSSSPSAPTS